MLKWAEEPGEDKRGDDRSQKRQGGSEGAGGGREPKIVQTRERGRGVEREGSLGEGNGAATTGTKRELDVS